MSTNDMAERRSILTAWLVVCAAVVAAPGARADESPIALVHDADYILRGATTAAVVAMQIHTRAYDRSYDMVYWEDARTPSQNKVLVKVLGPAEWRGHATLKAGGVVTLYNPGTDRMTNLSSSMLGDAWMGSHFNNDDFVKETDLARDYTIAETKAWDAPNPAGSGTVRFHDLELRPTPRAPIAWDHIGMEVYEENNHAIPVRFDYFRRADSGVTRSLSFSDVKDIGGRRAPTVLTMTVAEAPGEWTRVTYQKVRFDAPIPPAKFTESAMRQ